MDALWGIVAKMPEKGTGAPDAVTFTTILNAIREDALMQLSEDQSKEEIAEQLDKSVTDGRRIWIDIVKLWRRGELWIDDKLVSTMGRLLLIGYRPQDWDDVLSMVQQTMAISRFLPRHGTADRRAHGLEPLDAESRSSYALRKEDVTREPLPGQDLSDIADMDIRGDEFLPVDHNASTPAPAPAYRPETDARRNSFAYTIPTNRTLSLLLEACLKLVAKKPAQDYWTLLTSPKYGLQPDSDNFHMYLRILRQARASTETLHLLMSSSFTRLHLPKTFRIAMSACGRNLRSPRAVKDAEQMLDLMAASLRSPDPRTLLAFMHLVAARDHRDEQLAALERVARFDGALAVIAASEGVEVDEKQAIDGYYQRVAGVIGRLLREGLVEEKHREYWEGRRRKYEYAAGHARTERARRRVDDRRLRVARNVRMRRGDRFYEDYRASLPEKEREERASVRVRGHR